LNYGGRGITVCDRWRESFENFFADMGERPSTKHSIDRYPDNNGNYEPGNCRWATDIQQARNKRTTRYIEYNDIKLPLVEWAESKGIKPATLKKRLRCGWSIEKALNAPVDHSRIKSHVQ
jgi:hypothetical protein